MSAYPICFLSSLCCVFAGSNPRGRVKQIAQRGRAKPVHSCPPSGSSSEDSTPAESAALVKRATVSNKKKRPELRLEDFNKGSFRKWRSGLSYNMESDDPKFFCTVMAWLYREVYQKFSIDKPICPMKWIDFDK